MRPSIIASVLVTAILACQTLTPGPPPEPGPAKPSPAPTVPFSQRQAHFENQWVAFDHPEGLEVYAAGDATFLSYLDIDLGGDLVVGLGDPRLAHSGRYWRSIRILRRALPAGMDLTQLMTETYAQWILERASPPIGGEPGADGPVTVNARGAVQKVYRVDPSYEHRDIWIPVNAEVFIISIGYMWTTYQDVTDFNALADGILRTLVIK